MLTSSRQLAAAILALGVSASAGLADGHTKNVFAVVDEFEGLTLSFGIEAAPRGLQNLVLTVDGPRGYSATLPSGKGLPKIDLRDFGKPFDGPYTWEITGSYPNMIEINTPIDQNGRDAKARNEIMTPVSVDGAFTVVEGRIMAVERGKQEDG